MAKNTLYNKVIDLHKVRRLSSGEWQVAIGLHLIHEVTSPQAFAMLRERGLTVAHPGLTYATVDHIVPTDDTSRPLKDPLAEEMLASLERNCREYGIPLLQRTARLARSRLASARPTLRTCSQLNRLRRRS